MDYKENHLFLVSMEIKEELDYLTTVFNSEKNRKSREPMD